MKKIVFIIFVGFSVFSLGVIFGSSVIWDSSETEYIEVEVIKEVETIKEVIVEVPVDMMMPVLQLGGIVVSFDEETVIVDLEEYERNVVFKKVGPGVSFDFNVGDFIIVVADDYSITENETINEYYVVPYPVSLDG